MFEVPFVVARDLCTLEIFHQLRGSRLQSLRDLGAFVRLGFHYHARVEPRARDTQRQVAVALISFWRWTECRPGLRRRIDRATRMLGDVREELHVKSARQFR